MDTPNPDPGEEYQHVNTQLFGLIDPPATGAAGRAHGRPVQRAGRPRQRPTMDGFVTDYISAFTAEMGRQPTYDEYAQIMTGYTPEQMPVTLGAGPRFRDLRPLVLRGAVADVHQPLVLPRRAPSSGYVINLSPAESFPVHNTAETHLRAARVPGPDLAGLLRPAEPRVVHRPHPRVPAARPLRDELRHHRPVPGGRRQRAAADLLVHRAQHAARPQRHAPGRSTRCSPAGPRPAVLAARAARRCWPRSTTRSGPRRPPAGSNAYNTLLMVTFDEHGGTYDHVPPPAGAAARPGGPAGQMGFRSTGRACGCRRSPSRPGSRSGP